MVYSHKNNGKIFVKVDNGYMLNDLHNVKITSVANNNILKYNSSLAVWENVAGTTTNIAEGTNLYYTQGRFDSAFAAKSTTNLAEGTNLYFTTARGDANFATNFATKTTTNLPEGTNLYFTNARSRGALSVTAGTGIAYNSTTGNFNLGSIPNASLTNSSVTVNGLSLALGASISLTTTNIAEGTNLYWTDARFDSRFGTKTTTDLAEGTNLYYTQARFNTAFDAKTTTDLDEGTNLYYTDARSRAAFSENAVGLDYSSGSGILSLTAGYSIPTTVKLGQYDTAYNRSIVSAAVTGTSTKTLTLTEQDASTITATWTDQGITTINGTTNQIAANTVGNTTTVGFTNDVTFPNNVVVSGNLTINGTATYVNTQSISSKDPLFEVANDNNTTDAVDIGYYGRYYDSAQTRIEFTGLFRDASDAGKFKFFTGLVDEPTNVVDTTGTGYTVGTLVANVEGNLAGTANAANVLSTARTISATGDAAWSVSFNGSANATAALTLANTGVTASTYGTTTAVPTIAVDSKGRITSASNTNIAFPVTTVNGASGTVVLTTSNIAEGTNQYFTTGRAQSAISLTTTGTSGAATYSGGVINVPTYIGGSGTANEIAYFSTTGVISSLSTGTYPSLTELSYVKGVTSSIQTQFSGKQNALSGTGFVKISGTTISYDNSTYLTTSAASSTYLPLSGGTLTGALNGTSATFSNSVFATGGFGSAISSLSAWGSSIVAPIIEGIAGNAIANYNGGGGSAEMYIVSNAFYNGSSWVRKNASSSAILTMSGVNNTISFGGAATGTAGSAFTFSNILSMNASTGAATFSSSVNLARPASGATLLQLSGSAAYGDTSTINLCDGRSFIKSTILTTANGATDITFGTYNDVAIAERMRITSSGFLKASNNGTYVSTSGASHELYSSQNSNYGVIISQASAVPYGLSIRYTTVSPNVTGDLQFIACADTTNDKFIVWSSGTTVNRTGVYGTLSDETLKENIVDTTPKLDNLLKLKVRNFNFIGEDLKQLGFVAQEMEEVFPNMVDTDKEGIKSVKTTVLIPMLVKAMQEQQAQIEELKALIAAK